MERHDPARTGYALHTAGSIKDPAVAWHTSLGDDLPELELVSSSNLVYVTSNRALTAVDAATGNRQWRTTQFGLFPWNDERLFVETTPTLCENRLLVISGVSLYAVTPADGSAQWEYEAGSNFSETLSAGNTVYALSGDVLIAVDATSGLERWKTRVGSGVYPKAYAQEYIVGPVTDRDGVFGAVDASTGSIKWTRNIGINDVSRTGACITNDTVYCGTGPLYALNLSDGSTQWTRSLNTTDAELKPVSDGTTVYFVIGESNRVLALDANTGDVRWSTTLQGIEDDSAPALTAETLYVSLTHGVVAFDRSTGDERFRVRLSETEGSASSPIVTGNTLYTRIDTTLYALTDQ